MKKIKLITAQLVVLLFFTTSAHALDITLDWSTWDNGTYIDHYVVYWGNSSGNYTDSSFSIPGNQTSHTITGLADGQVYFFAMKSFDAQGNSSDYSNEVKSFEILSPGNNFTVNSSNFKSFSLTGIGLASSNVEVMNGDSMTSLGKTTADSSGKWSITIDLSSTAEGPLKLIAIQDVMSAEINGIYDTDPPSSPNLLSVTK